MVFFVSNSNLCVVVYSGEENIGDEPGTYCHETRQINCRTRPIWSHSLTFISLLLHCIQLYPLEVATPR